MTDMTGEHDALQDTTYAGTKPELPGEHASDAELTRTDNEARGYENRGTREDRGAA